MKEHWNTIVYRIQRLRELFFMAELFQRDKSVIGEHVETVALLMKSGEA